MPCKRAFAVNVRRDRQVIQPRRAGITNRQWEVPDWTYERTPKVDDCQVFLPPLLLRDTRELARPLESNFLRSVDVSDDGGTLELVEVGVVGGEVATELIIVPHNLFCAEVGL